MSPVAANPGEFVILAIVSGTSQFPSITTGKRATISSGNPALREQVFLPDQATIREPYPVRLPDKRENVFDLFTLPLHRPPWQSTLMFSPWSRLTVRFVPVGVSRILSSSTGTEVTVDVAVWAAGKPSGYPTSLLQNFFTGVSYSKSRAR